MKNTEECEDKRFTGLVCDECGEPHAKKRFCKFTGEHQSDLCDYCYDEIYNLNHNTSIKLTDYINEYHKGNKAAFARSMNVRPQLVTTWINGDWIVIDGKLYTARRSMADGEKL